MKTEIEPHFIQIMRTPVRTHVHVLNELKKNLLIFKHLNRFHAFSVSFRYIRGNIKNPIHREIQIIIF